MTPEERNTVIEALEREILKADICAAVCFGLAAMIATGAMLLLPMLFL